MRIVLTGGPCSGKSTILAEMGKIGYTVMEEAAREVIAESQKDGGPLPWTDRDAYQRIVLERQLVQFHAAGDADAVFDRGIPDGWGFYVCDGMEAPQELINASAQCRYDVVFLLELLPDYVNDDQRKEGREQSQRLEQAFFDIYTRLGYDVIRVPSVSVEERVEIIKKQLALLQ